MEIIGDGPNKIGRSEYETEMAFLKRTCPETGQSLYDHLCDLVHYALSNKMRTELDSFEQCSRMLRERKKVCRNWKSKPQGKGDCYEHALRAREVLKADEDGGNADVSEDDMGGECDDVLETLHFAKHCGIGIPPDEALAIAVAIKKLASTRTLTAIRFWGKVLGRCADYVVVEAELTDDELDRRVDLASPTMQAQLEDPLNRKVFLVNGDPCGGGAWRELPPIRPRHVVAARGWDRRRALLTGCLDAQVQNFPGAESHLLHAQLARISSSCAISPLGAFVQSPAAAQDLVGAW